MRLKKHIKEDYGGYGMGIGPSGVGIGRGSGTSLVNPNDPNDDRSADSLEGDLSDIRNKTKKVIELLKSGSLEDAAKKAVRLFFRYGAPASEELASQMADIKVKGWKEEYDKQKEAYKEGK